MSLGEHDELMLLRKENEQLRMEREILTKAAVCWRREKIDQPYRLKFDQGAEPVFWGTGCG